MAPPNTQNVKKPMSYAQAAGPGQGQEKRKQISPAATPPPSKRVEHPKDDKQESPSAPTVSREKGKAPASANPTQDEDATEEPDAEPTMSTPLALTLTHHTGSLFAALPTTVLIHACNTQGSWAAGIALTFRNSYPNAYKRYRAHCVNAHDPKTNPVPTGTCFLIPPCETPVKSGGGVGSGSRHRGGGIGRGRGGTGVRGRGGGASSSRSPTNPAPSSDIPEPPKHWIACLFTSARYGKAKDSPAQILAATGLAMRDLLRQVEAQRRAGKEIGGLRMCKINSGLFGVKWESTVDVLHGIEVRDGETRDVEVWSID